MTRLRIGIRFAPLLVALAVLIEIPATAAHHAVLRFNLEEMTATADRIFVGRCVTVEQTEERIAQGVMPVTRYSFEVERVLKGRLPGLITFRQIGHPSRRASGKGGEIQMHGQSLTQKTFIHGMSEYRVGDRVVLFLIRNYMDGKVTYPVGLYQGAFFVSRLPSGQELARNSINNLGLFTAPYNGTSMKETGARIIFPERDEPLSMTAGLSAKSLSLAQKRGAIPLEPLLELVERIVAAHGGEKGALITSGKGASLQ